MTNSQQTKTKPNNNNKRNPKPAARKADIHLIYREEFSKDSGIGGARFLWKGLEIEIE